MEEDAGKLIHDPWTDETLVDFNRCGVPLIEIVTQPDMRTPEEAVDAVRAIRASLAAIGVSDCRMQEGSLRVDVNLSVRPAGATELGTRTEMKNINSLKSISRAVSGEAARQIERIELGREIIQETRRWDDNKDTSHAMRSKEDAHDYRYFPEPDLSPLEITPEWIESLRQRLPELPDSKRERYPREYGLSAYDTEILIGEKRLSDLFENTARLCGKPKEAANWIMVEVLSRLKERSIAADEMELDAGKLARIIELTTSGSINRNAARQTLDAVMDEGADVDGYIAARGLSMVGDETAVRAAVDGALAKNADAVARYRAGEEKVLGFLIGQAMKALQGKGDPAAVRKAMAEAISGANGVV
jgi:aspartyl-tRNA(Asn)/glutamyl-tRNA(Gln) amidotransferase subunit B